MEQIKYLTIILILLLFLCGCHEENDDVINERALNIIVQYEDEFGLHIDYNAKIFIYYGIYTSDIADFTYSSNGILIFGNQKIIPDIETSITGKEDATIAIDCVMKITLIAESSYWLNRRMTQSFSPGNIPIKSTFIFTKNEKLF